MPRVGSRDPAGAPRRASSDSQPASPQPSPNACVGDNEGRWQPKLRGLYVNEAEHKDSFSRRVAVTFDDGPHPVNTPKVLDVLKRHGVKATFFVTGENAARHPQLVRRIVAEGHTLGNHSFDHANLAKKDRDGVKQEFERTQEVIDRVLGRPYPLTQIRPPYGAMNSDVKERIDQTGTAVMWNIDSLDWKYGADTQKVLDSIFQGADPTFAKCGSESVYARGGVILFHDIQSNTPTTLDAALARLRREGFDIVKTDDFLREKYFAPS